MTGGALFGKLIILSFRDDEDVLFNKTMSALASVTDFSTATASVDAPLLFGSLQIDPQRRLVWQAGQTVDLTPMEFDILLLLARRPGQVFTARQIYEAVAADSFDASWTGISSMVYKLSASWAPVSSKPSGVMGTNSLPQTPHQNEASAQRIYFRCALLFDGYFLFSMINSQSHDILRLGDY